MNKVLTLIFFCIAISACNIENLGPTVVSEHILIINNEGEIIGGNTNDWKIINNIHGLKILYPPFPNPTQNNSCWMVYSSLRRVNGYLRYESGEIARFTVPPSDSIRHLIRGNDFGFSNILKRVDVIINDTLVTSGHIQFEH